MTDNRKAGWALILGSVGGMVTMAIHPVGGGKLSAEQVGHLMSMSGIAHGLALVSVLLLFPGTCGLAKFLAGPDRMAFSALVTYGFAAVAIMIAASVSGWIVPDIMKLMTRDVAANEGTWRMMIASIFRINQAMARIYSVGAAVAITLWSVCCLREGRLSRGMAIFGCVTAPLIAVLIFVGHLRLDVHGMTVVMLSEVIWFVGMGVGLMRADTRLSANAAEVS
jgi:ABC-type multidrug transport system fused ATPase/permease subunit